MNGVGFVMEIFEEMLVWDERLKAVFGSGVRMEHGEWVLLMKVSQVFDECLEAQK